jgi:hypothetical protein
MILGSLFRVDGSCILVYCIVGVASAAGVLIKIRKTSLPAMPLQRL